LARLIFAFDLDPDFVEKVLDEKLQRRSAKLPQKKVCVQECSYGDAAKDWDTILEIAKVGLRHLIAYERKEKYT